MSVDTAVVGIKSNQTDPNKAELSHTRNQTKKKEKYPPPLNLHTAAVYVAVRNFLK